MIVEHEVIEQIEEEPNGRALPWVCELIRTLGPSRPMEVLLDRVALGARMMRDLNPPIMTGPGGAVPSRRTVDLRAGDDAELETHPTLIDAVRARQGADCRH